MRRSPSPIRPSAASTSRQGASRPGFLSETGIRRCGDPGHPPNVYAPSAARDEIDETVSVRSVEIARSSRSAKVCAIELNKLLRLHRTTPIHSFYTALAHRAPIHYAKRGESADLSGRVALLTFGSVKIVLSGRISWAAGAHVVVTTRFPRDAALRYTIQTRRVADFSSLRARLRHTPASNRAAITSRRTWRLIHRTTPSNRQAPARLLSALEIDASALAACRAGATLLGPTSLAAQDILPCRDRPTRRSSLLLPASSVLAAVAAPLCPGSRRGRPFPVVHPTDCSKDLRDRNRGADLFLGSSVERSSELSTRVAPFG